MTFPPCYTPDDEDAPPDPSRRVFMIESAAATAGIFLAPRLAAQTPAAKRAENPHAIPISLDVNGKLHTLKLDPRTTLLDALREHLDLTGTKKGCDQGACGACTVLADGRRINSCLMLAATCEGRDITTIEGLGQDGGLHPVQRAFIACDASQCGFCTPGQILSAVGLLAE